MNQIMQRGDAESLFEHSMNVVPQVRDLLVAQERLLTAAEALLEHCQEKRAPANAARSSSGTG